MGRKLGTPASQLVKNGKIKGSDLMDIVPKDTVNKFRPDADLRKGFKYEFAEPSTGKKIRIHGHEANPRAPTGSTSKEGWTVRIRSGNKFLTKQGEWVYQGQARGARANDTHIKFDTVFGDLTQ